jgi:hypothetical protein
MSGPDTAASVKAAQRRRAAAYIISAHHDTVPSAREANLRRAYRTSGLAFRIAFEEFVAEIESYWRSVDAEGAATDNR